MPRKISDSDGNEIEMYTKEEVESQTQEAIKQHEEELNSKVESAKSEVEEEYKTKLEEREQELATLKESLEGLDEKDKSFADLRQKVKEKDQEISGLKEEFTSQIRGLRESITSSTVEELASTLSSGDSELKEKIVHHYGRISDKADTKEEIAKKMSDAYTLATGSVTPDPLKQAIGTQAAAPQRESANVSDELKAVAPKFGLTQEDIDKYNDKQQ